MLKEKQITGVNSTYDKDLSKIIHDPRYLKVAKQYRMRVYDEYLEGVNQETYRKKMWQKHNTIKAKFEEVLENLISQGIINSATEYKQFQQIMTSNAEYSKQFYDVLHREDKEFMYSEFTNRIQTLRQSNKDQSVDQFK